MGLRRSVWEALGGFDQMFGTGASLHSAEDLDLTLRALLKGHAIYKRRAYRSSIMDFIGKKNARSSFTDIGMEPGPPSRNSSNAGDGPW